MKEFENQEVGEKMSWKGFVSKLIQPDAPGLNINFDPCLLVQKKTNIFDAATDEILNFLGQFIKASQF